MTMTPTNWLDMTQSTSSSLQRKIYVDQQADGGGDAFILCVQESITISSLAANNEEATAKLRRLALSLLG